MRRGENPARGWRAKARRQRWIDAAFIGAALVAGGFMLRETEWFHLRDHWPLLMPVLIMFGSRLVTGQHQHGGVYYRAAALAAGDRSVVEQYPPVVQAALVRAATAGANTATLLPLGHRALWRIGVAMPPVAFSPWWLYWLVMCLDVFLMVPLWLLVQQWWNAEAVAAELFEMVLLLSTILAMIFGLVSLGHRGTREKLGLPRWRDFRRDWKLRRIR